MSNSSPMFKNALVSVFDKTQIVEFIKPLYDQGMRVVSTGGTAEALKSAGIEVIDVSEQTGFPEVMDGRVKTLHPRVHMALLARDKSSEDTELLKQQGLEPFDLVVGNLYPFEKALERNLSQAEQVEFIDIGGPSFLRAAAKSFERVAVVCDPSDYSDILEKAELTLEDRKKLAAKVFTHTSHYDQLIANYLSESNDENLPQSLSLNGNLVSELRYGENPQQQAAWYTNAKEQGGLHEAEQLQGKALSFNNLLDLEAAITTLREFSDKPTCISVKHNNPCGIGFGEDIARAVESSLKADPVSVFGGIVAVNGPVTETVAKHFTKLFLECVIAPKVEAGALEIFKKKKNLRVLEWPEMMQAQFQEGVFKTVLGGFLYQDTDIITEWSDHWQLHGETPSPQLKEQIVNTWKACARLKSNAIAICGPHHSVGFGMGQVNRVDAVEQAIGRWKQFHPEVKSVVLASDAFFPFADSIEKAANAGVRWVIQPGGSIKDSEVISKAKELSVNMILTGTRHFLH